MSHLNQEESASFDLDFALIWSTIKRRKVVIITPVIVGLLIFFVIKSLLPPLYFATTVIAYDPEESRIITAPDSPLKQTSEPMRWTISKLRAESEVMQSVLVLRRVVKSLELHKNQEFLRSSRQDLIKKRIKSWLGEEEQDKAVSSSKASAPMSKRSEKALINYAVSKIKEGLTVNVDKFTFLIRITFSSTDAELAAKIANGIPKALQLHQLDNRFVSAKRAIDWLKVQLEQARLSVEEADRLVEAHKEKYKLVDASGKSEYQTQLDNLKKKLEASITNTQNVRIRLEELKNSSGSDINAANARNSPLVQELRNKLSDARKRNSELTARLGSKHPQVINVRAEIAAIKRQLKEESKNVLGAVEAEYKLAQKSELLLKERIDALTMKAQAAKVASTKFRELLGSARVKGSLYDSLLKRLQETSQYKQLESTDFQTVTKALVPQSVTEPQWFIIGVGIFIVMTGFGIVLAFGLEFLDSRLRTMKQLQSATGLTVISVVPKIKSKTLALFEQGQSGEEEDRQENILVYTEAISHIKSEIQLSNRENVPKTIVITSPSMNEGKSTLALSFARHMAKLGSNTLLIDCDLRKPSILTKLRKNADHGLADVLQGKAKLEQALITDTQTNLQILPTVIPTASAASELLGSKKMSDFLESIRSTYDFIIMDSAPILPVQDTRTLATKSDAVVLITAWGETKRSAAEQAVGKLRTIDANIIGAVLNKADPQTITSHYTDVYGYV